MAAKSSSRRARDAAARLTTISGKTHTTMRAPTFWPGRKRSPAADWMRSSSTHRDAERRSRTMGSCSGTIPNSRNPLEPGPRSRADPARIVSSLTRDVTELMSEIGLQAHVNPTGQRVAYHSACSLQHGQQIREQPKRLLKEAGFVVLDPPEGHLCCGSAGTYNLLQPEIARRLRDRKVANIGATSPDLIAAGNIGCLTQIASGTKVPVVHTVELLDWATGGPRPKASVR